jgi:iron complex outermembrane receptor protein
VAIALALALPAWAAQAQSTATVQLRDVNVSGDADARLPRASGRLDLNSLVGKPSYYTDTAQLLAELPGVSVYGAGGVSALPVIRGLADDRLRITIDGVDAIASCPNHMNAPLSYIDPSQVASVRVYAGITPVSAGGDSIGGSIIVESAAPQFAEPGQSALVSGEAGAAVRSFGGQSLHLAASYATENLALSYHGATSQADNYKAGAAFKTSDVTGNIGHTLPLDEVGSTAYETRNHQLGLAFKNGAHLFEAQANLQDLPYQLYPNQRMDMLDNQMKRFTLRYQGRYDWGTLSARAWHEKVDHYMDFGPDKRYWYGNGAPPTGSGGPMALNGSPCAPLSMTCAAGMPMYTASRTDGAALQAVVPLREGELLRAGLDFVNYRLNDWWPPSGGGMWPGTFENIKNGRRERSAIYGEWERQHSAQWMTQLGLRAERVQMDADPVRGYSTAPNAMGMQARDAAAFNALARGRTDHNWDFTALARYTHSEALDAEFGFAHKTRSPNLYEVYPWSTWQMAALMNNFVGDGNGYIGNPALKPEKANTLSATWDWHAADRQAWQLSVTPYYTRVDDYIDAQQWDATANAPRTTLLKNQFTVLRYVNQTARLQGVDVAGQMALAKNDWGAWSLAGKASYTQGKNLTTGDHLYQIMPLHARLALTQALGPWRNAVEWVAVAGKRDVNAMRNEIETPGYALVNLRASYTHKSLRVDFGVENLFDRYYVLPQGGAYVGQGTTMTTGGGSSPKWGTGVPGPGRALYAGVTYKF